MRQGSTRSIGLVHTGALCSAAIFLWLLPTLVTAGPDSTAAGQGWLGVYTDNLTEPMLVALNLTHGVLVTEVLEGSPASKAGLQMGDVITEIEGEAVYNGQKLRSVVRTRPGRKVQIRIRRRGQEKTLEAVLQARTRDRRWRGYFPDFPDPRTTKRPLEEKIERHIPLLDSLRKEIEALRENLRQLQERLRQ